MKKNDYLDLGEKLLNSGEITLDDYYSLKSSKEFYEIRYNELFKECLSYSSLIYWFCVVLVLLFMSVMLNFGLYFNVF